MLTFAEGMADGVSLAEGNWGGHKRLMLLSEFRVFRSELLTHDLIRERVPGSPNQGFELTEDGSAFFKKIVADNSPTPPTA